MSSSEGVVTRSGRQLTTPPIRAKKADSMKQTCKPPRSVKVKQRESPGRCSICGDFGRVILCGSQCGNAMCVWDEDSNTGCIALEPNGPASVDCMICLKKKKAVCRYTMKRIGSQWLQFTSTLPRLCVLFMDGPDQFAYGSKLIGTHLKEFLDTEPEKLHLQFISLHDVNTFVKNYRPLKAWHNRYKQMPVTKLVVVQTHADQNGHLVYGTNHKGNISTSLPDILSAYVCSTPYQDVLLSNPHGRRGVIMWACGQAMGHPEHFQLVRSVLDSHPFDFVLGFTGGGVIPHVVGPSIARFCVLCAEYLGRDIVKLALQAFSLKSILTSTPVVVVHRPDPAGPIVSTRIAYSVGFDFCWGIAHRCPQCKSGPPYIACHPHRKHQKDHQRVQFSCNRCLWRLSSVYFEKPDWVRIREDYVVQLPHEHPDFLPQAFDAWLKQPGHAEVWSRYQLTVRGRASAKILDWLSREENKDREPPEELYPDNDTLQQSDAGFSDWLVKWRIEQERLARAQSTRHPAERSLTSLQPTMSTTRDRKRTAREFENTPPTLSDDTRTAAAHESERPSQRRRFQEPRRFSVERRAPRNFDTVSPPPPEIILPY